MEHVLIIVNGWKPLTIITKYFILDVAAVLDPPLASALSSTNIFKSKGQDYFRKHEKQ